MSCCKATSCDVADESEIYTEVSIGYKNFNLLSIFL